MGDFLVLVLLSSSVKRVSVSHVLDFFLTLTREGIFYRSLNHRQGTLLPLLLWSETALFQHISACHQ